MVAKRVVPSDYANCNLNCIFVTRHTELKLADCDTCEIMRVKKISRSLSEKGACEGAPLHLRQTSYSFQFAAKCEHSAQLLVHLQQVATHPQVSTLPVLLGEAHGSQNNQLSAFALCFQRQSQDCQ